MFTQNEGVVRHVITMVTDLPHEIEAGCELKSIETLSELVSHFI